MLMRIGYYWGCYGELVELNLADGTVLFIALRRQLECGLTAIYCIPDIPKSMNMITLTTHENDSIFKA